MIVSWSYSIELAWGSHGLAGSARTMLIMCALPPWSDKTYSIPSGAILQKSVNRCP